MLERTKYIEEIKDFYDSDLIKILVGIRRCGKSIILDQIMEDLKKKKIDENHIISINFEFIEYENLKQYKALYKYIKDKIIDNKMYYIFIDEIQYVEEFEKCINSLRASLKNVSIFITGSNSRLLSNELSTLLSGRYVSFKIHPLSYKEILELCNIESSKEVLFDYMKWGSLPNRFEFKNETAIKNYLNGVYDSIILRDVIERLKIRDVSLFNLILQYILDTIGREFSANHIIEFLKKEGREVSTLTIYSYLDALCNALLIKKVFRYDIQGKAILKTLNKYYATDLGIAEIKNNKKEINSYTLENIVYNELLIKGYEVYSGKTKKGEIDFVVMKDNLRKYIQVSYSVENEETKKREFDAFNGVNDNYPKYVITLDKENYNYNGIQHLNILDFLLSDEF